MTHDDRRKHARKPISVPVRVKDTAQSTTSVGTSQDLSEGGVRLVMGTALSRGQVVSLEIDLDEDGSTTSVHTHATVMWSQTTDSGEYVAGLQFDAGSEEGRERLKSLLSKG